MAARRRSATVPDRVTSGFDDASESAWRAATRLPVAHFDYVPTLCARPAPPAAELQCVRCDARLLARAAARVCASCHGRACAVCCSCAVWDARARRAASVCSHCYRVSSRITWADGAQRLSLIHI